MTLSLSLIGRSCQIGTGIQRISVATQRIRRNLDAYMCVQHMYAIYRGSSTQMLYLYSLSSSSNPRNRDMAIVPQPRHRECHKCRIARAPAGKFAPRSRLYRTDVPCHFAFNRFPRGSRPTGAQSGRKSHPLLPEPTFTHVTNIYFCARLAADLERTPFGLGYQTQLASYEKS